MRGVVLCVFVALIPGAAVSQSFQADRQGFVLRQGKQIVRFDRGHWSAGIEGGGSVRWHEFLWHDAWVYETLPGGKIERGPTLEADGGIALSGTFSARESSPPVKYACRIVPGPEGVRVRYTFEKTGPLKLTRGICLHVFADEKTMAGTNRVWMRPGWHGVLAGRGGGNADSLWIELGGRRSLRLSLPGVRQIDSESGRGFGFRVDLVPRDFEPGQKVEAEYSIAFAEMPEKFPGQIEPSARLLAIGPVAANAAAVPQYGRLELRVDLAATYENPFDPDQVRLDAVFTTPSGKQVEAPGFFMVDYRRQRVDDAEVLLPEGNGRWCVRFAPVEVGRHTWRLRARDRSGEVVGGAGAFEAVAGKSPGFVRVSKADPHYFAFDNGSGFFPIGHNYPIYHARGQTGEDAMRKFAAAGENYNRWWMSSSGLGIEWSGRLGWYRQDNAARIDAMLDLAEELGLYYMMCMDTHQDFREAGWLRNPFNAANGGPCQTPAEWFTHPTARQLYKKRLRYTVARWGYSPHVFCWEFGNEFEGWQDSPDAIKLPWHKEMSDYLRSIDPWGHLITTSFWGHTGPEDYWKLDNIDIVQTHCYTNDDGNVAEPVRRYCLHQWRRFAKPHVFGEFGIRSHATTADKDPRGWAIHNSLWAGLTSLAAGGPMPWWHENYIDPLDLYFHFTALARFAKDLPLGTERWEPLEASELEFIDRSKPPETRDAVVLPRNQWGKPEHDEFRVLSDGSVADDRLPLQLLHGRGHRDLRNPPTFVVDYPRPGKFIVHVDKVSHSGRLQIIVDGALRLDRELPCGEKRGKASVYRPQWKLWETTYDEDFAVEIPAGRRRIRVDNQGDDWIAVTRYVFTGCKVLDKPNVLVCGMKSPSVAVVWLQNRESCWHLHGRQAVGPVDAFRLALAGFGQGRHRLEWWETWEGRPSRTEELAATDSRLILAIPKLTTDVAVKIRRP